jgi:ankyrin repeat protein
MTKFTVDNINSEGWETIHKAAYCGDYNILIEELNNNIDVNLIANNFISLYKPDFSKSHSIYFDNVTPLYLAAQKGHSKCVKLLINRGADPTILTNNTYLNSSCTAFSVAWWCSNYKAYKIMKKGSKKEGLLAQTFNNPENETCTSLIIK